MMPPDEDHLNDCVDDGDCWQCGGEGWIANCFEEFACLDPEGGCDDCLRPCDICNTGRPPRPST